MMGPSSWFFIFSGKSGFSEIFLSLLADQRNPRRTVSFSRKLFQFVFPDMTRHAIFRSPAAGNKRQPLLASSESELPMSPPSIKSPAKTARRKKAAEVAGGAAAECAAVWCCCPCAVVNLVVLAVYRVPAAVCRKAWRRRKLRRCSEKRQGLLAAAAAAEEGSDLSGRLRSNGEDLTAEAVKEGGGEQNDVVDLEKEMWDHFDGAGFWRSPSQRDT